MSLQLSQECLLGHMHVTRRSQTHVKCVKKIQGIELKLKLVVESSLISITLCFIKAIRNLKS